METIDFYCVRWLHGFYKMEGEIHDFFYAHNRLFSEKYVYSNPLLF